MNENIEKLVLVIKKIEAILKESLGKFPPRDLENLLRSNRMFFLEKKHLEDTSKLKIQLYELVEIIKKKYEKIIALSTPRDIFSEIFMEINRLFPEVFPNDYEEFTFKKLMEKTFLNNKINNIYPYLNEYETLIDKNKKYR